MTHSCTTKGDLLLKTIYILSLLLLRRPNLLYMLYVHITIRLSILYETRSVYDLYCFLYLFPMVDLIITSDHVIYLFAFACQ